MTKEHKDKLAAGRKEAQAVKDYLEALRTRRPRRRRRNPSDLKKRLGEVQKEMTDAGTLQLVQLAQERLDLEDELEEGEETDELPELEKGFVRAVGPYSERKGLTYDAWRSVGVPPDVLRKAGLSR